MAFSFPHFIQVRPQHSPSGLVSFSLVNLLWKSPPPRQPQRCVPFKCLQCSYLIKLTVELMIARDPRNTALTRSIELMGPHVEQCSDSTPYFRILAQDLQFAFGSQMPALEVWVCRRGWGCGSAAPIFYLVPPSAAKLVACSISKVGGEGDQPKSET